MPSYILRWKSEPDMDLMRRFKARAIQEGIPMRALVLKLIEAYAAGKINMKAIGE